VNLRELFAEPPSSEPMLAWAGPPIVTSKPSDRVHYHVDHPHGSVLYDAWDGSRVCGDVRDFDTQAARTFADDLDVVSAQAEVVRLNDAARGLPVPGDRGRRG
jgi:hypothetical protein